MFGDPVLNSRQHTVRKLADLGELNRGVSKARPRNTPDLLGGPYPLIQTGEIAAAQLYIDSYENTYSEKGLAQSRMWPKGTLCITIAANIAQTAILAIDACFPDSVVGFIPGDEVTQIYMHCWFSFFQKILDEQAPQVAQKNINLKILSNLDVMVPPLELQKKFEDFVKQSDKSKFACLKSQFIEMFGDPESVIKNAINTVADVADVQVGLVIKPTRFYSADGTGTPAFRSLNIGEMYIRDSEWVYFTDKGMVENQRTIAHTGDVLVVRSGYPGTSCVVTPEYDGRNVVDLIIAHPNVSKILPEFLCAFTNYPHGKIQIENSQRGVAQKHFNVSLYNKMKIVVPPMELQKQFVQLLHQSDKSK